MERPRKEKLAGYQRSDCLKRDSIFRIERASNVDS